MEPGSDYSQVQNIHLCAILPPDLILDCSFIVFITFRKFSGVISSIIFMPSLPYFSGTLFTPVPGHLILTLISIHVFFSIFSLCVFHFGYFLLLCLKFTDLFSACISSCYSHTVHFSSQTLYILALEFNLGFKKNLPCLSLSQCLLLSWT